MDINYRVQNRIFNFISHTLKSYGFQDIVALKIPYMTVEKNSEQRGHTALLRVGGIYDLILCCLGFSCNKHFSITVS